MSAEPTAGHAIETLFLEERRYPPPPEFAARANAKPDIYDRDFDEFWAGLLAEAASLLRS